MEHLKTLRWKSIARDFRNRGGREITGAALQYLHKKHFSFFLILLGGVTLYALYDLYSFFFS